MFVSDDALLGVSFTAARARLATSCWFTNGCACAGIGLSPGCSERRTPDARGSSGAADAPGGAARPRDDTGVGVCGPDGAETLVLIHGVAGTAELNWGMVFAPLARHFRVVAADLRGHGDGIRLRSRFRLEDCADDIAALAGVLDIDRFAAVGYSMGGMVAQLLYQRHAALLSGLVLCSTASNVRGSPAEQLAARAMPAVAAVLRLEPNAEPDERRGFRHGAAGPR